MQASAAGPVVVTRNGKAVAVLIGVEDDDELERLLLAHSSKLRAILDAADSRIDQGAGINLFAGDKYSIPLARSVLWSSRLVGQVIQPGGLDTPAQLL